MCAMVKCFICEYLLNVLYSVTSHDTLIPFIKYLGHLFSFEIIAAIVNGVWYDDAWRNFISRLLLFVCRISDLINFCKISNFIFNPNRYQIVVNHIYKVDACNYF